MRHRQPDQGRAHRRQQRKEGHDHGQQQRTLNAQGPQRHAADHPLHDGHHDVALDGGADHGGELVQEVVGVRRGQRQRIANGGRQLGAVSQQEIQHVQHQRRSSPGTRRCSGRCSARAWRSAGWPPPRPEPTLRDQAFHIAQAEAVQQVKRPARDHRHHLLEVGAKLISPARMRCDTFPTSFTSDNAIKTSGRTTITSATVSVMRAAVLRRPPIRRTSRR